MHYTIIYHLIVYYSHSKRIIYYAYTNWANLQLTCKLTPGRSLISWKALMYLGSMMSPESAGVRVLPSMVWYGEIVPPKNCSYMSLSKHGYAKLAI